MNTPLYRFAHSRRIITPFVEHYGCGWFDGGCFIFARALQLWLGGRLAVIVRRELLYEQAFDHVVLSLPDSNDSQKFLYVDADGVATGEELLECWRTHNRLPNATLEDPADRVRFVGHLEKESWASWLAEELKTRFGMPKRLDLHYVLGRTQTQEQRMKNYMSLAVTPSRNAKPRTAKRDPNLDQCGTCDNARVVPHPDQDKAESLVIPCPDCSQITRPIRRKYLADPTACPWCGGAIQADAAPDVDEGVVTQEIDCTECNRRWFDLYRLADMRPL